MNWKHKASIKIQLDPKNKSLCNSDRLENILSEIRREFNLDSSTTEVGVSVLDRQRIFVEFTAASTKEDQGVLSLVEALERLFFDLKIYSRYTRIQKI